MKRLGVWILLLAGGCYDVDALEHVHDGVRLVATDTHTLTPELAFDLALPDSVLGDQQLLILVLVASSTINDPPTLEGWNAIRVHIGQCGTTLVAYTRASTGPADATVHVEVPTANSIAAAAAAVRGLDPALPLGPIGEGTNWTSHKLDISPPYRTDERWIGLGASPGGNFSLVLDGVPEFASNGRVSILFGDPGLPDGGTLTYGVSGDVIDCTDLFLIALMPR
jgi:hypothetical protein